MNLSYLPLKGVAAAAGVAAAIAGGGAAAWAATTESDVPFGQQVKVQVMNCRVNDPGAVGACVSSWVRTHNPGEASEARGHNKGPRSTQPSPRPSESPDTDEQEAPEVKPSPRPSERPDSDGPEAPEVRPSPRPSPFATHRR